jgi:Spy/CpxP family protein refolding chaperone
MKRNVITLAATIAVVTAGFVIAQGEPKTGGAPANTNALAPGAGPRQQPFAGQHGESFTKLTDRLNLTPEQKAKVQPILDQARPQMQQIREEAAQKMRSVMEGTMGQIRPLLTPEQQTKLDEMQQARANMQNAMHKMHGAEGD